MNVEQETRYPPGNSVTVHYDPANPRRSFVDARRYMSPISWIVGLSVYPVIAAVMEFGYIWISWAWHKD
jgi:hypothetical protein